LLFKGQVSSISAISAQTKIVQEKSLM